MILPLGFCTVTVIKGDIVINKSTDSVLVGGTLQLTATTTPGGRTVSWSSSDTSVATVSSTGLVTFNRAGTVTVTASASGLNPQTVTLYGIVSDGVYTLKNAGSQMYVQMEGTHLFQSSDIAQVGSSGSTNVTMMWRFHYIGSGKYTIRSYANPTLALGDNADTLPENATTYFTSTTSETGFVNTQWYISDDGVGYILTNVQTGRILAVPVGNTTAGTQLIFKDSIESASGSSCRWFKGTISSIPTGIYLYIYNETTHQTTGFTASSTTMNIDDYRCIKGIYRNPNDISQQFSYGTSDNSTNVVIVNGGGGVSANDFGKKTVSITHTSSGTIKSYTVWVRDYSDMDYDGISDSLDGTVANNNLFEEELKTQYSESEVSYTVDYRKLFTGNTVYQSDLSTLSSLMSTLIYNGSTLESESNSRDIVSWLSYHGMYSVKKVLIGNNSSDNHKSEIALGYKPVYYNGQGKLIITVVVRGTNGTLAEWSSNMDIGNTDDFSDYPEWTVADNHIGFDIAANRLMYQISQYVATILQTHPELAAYTPTYWVTGHSRGGAIANIIAAKLIDQGQSVYAYTFAAPNTTEASTANATKYNCIFNIVNSDDFIPYFPLSQWGFKRYGKTAKVSVADTCKAEWETMIGKDYKKMTDPTAPLAELAEIAGSRNGCYAYKSGSDGYVILSDDNKYPLNTSGYYKLVDDKIYQSPMFLMQYFAAVATDEDEPSHKTGTAFLFLNVASYLESTKSALLSQVTGMSPQQLQQSLPDLLNQDRVAYPHYPESYYLISHYAYSN
ncbi:MAG: Ig-like domain-containing protein [Eubacteriales bacterium]